MNAMKAKGDRYERRLAEILAAAGFPDVKRTKAGYERDAGDLHMDRTPAGPRVIVQAKDVATPPWTEWLAKLEEQIEESGAEVGFIVKKHSRRGGQSPLHIAILPLDAMVELLARAGYGDNGNG
ncbi:holliday junction resolvase [Gordonia phage TinaLin]|uniref:Holliday junction resolvase n=1 Tax=Gordonia phage TinaLin TaxID=2797324 RepID=A0A7T7GTF4_9CAUD|nr:holliday junction resolvase [Gordonia phage TinaLin]QQM15144.1 holliday junction resolvase [Gordonia phage TinaLin]